MTSNSFESDQSNASFPSVQKPRMAKWLLSLLTFSLIAGGSYLAYRQFVVSPQRVKQQTQIVPVERQNLKITVSANGTVEPDYTINVSPKSAGIMTKLLVKEGDYVNKGQILAYMDGSNLKGQLMQAKAKVAAAEANLRKLVAGNRPQDIAQAQARVDELAANLRKLVAGNRPQDIAQAQARLESAQATYLQAEDDFRRNQMLQNEGAISQQALNEKRVIRDRAKASVDEAKQALSLQQAGTRTEDIEQARAELTQQQQVLELLKVGTRTEDIEQASAEVNAARGAEQSIETEIDDTVIRAPFSGIVSRKYADPGAFVTPMTAGSSVSSATSSSILSLASPNIVVTNVAESQIAKIKVGQLVAITADAYPGQSFKGKVSRIATQAIVEQNVTSFEVEVTLLNGAAQQLRSGMNVSAEFQVGQLQNILTVPTVSITRQNNVTGVFVGKPDHPPQFVPITTGASLDDRTEVKSGLNGSEKILIAVPPEKPPQSVFSLQNLFGGSAKDRPPAGGSPRDRPPS